MYTKTELTENSNFHIVFCKWKTATFYLFAANGNRKRKFVCLGQQTINVINDQINQINEGGRGPSLLNIKPVHTCEDEGMEGFCIWFGSLFEIMVQDPDLGSPPPLPH